jgi:hypothetical protein
MTIRHAWWKGLLQIPAPLTNQAIYIERYKLSDEIVVKKLWNYSHPCIFMIKYKRMKKLLSLLLAIIPLINYAQSSILSPDPHEKTVKMPVIFIDSVRMDSVNNYLMCIETNKIADIRIEKGNKYPPNGAMFIKLKDHNLLKALMDDKQLSLHDIVKANVEPSEFNKSVIYFLNDKLLTDTTRIRIPATRVYTVTVTRANETIYFKTAFPGSLILTIKTHPPVIYIR